MQFNVVVCSREGGGAKEAEEEEQVGIAMKNPSTSFLVNTGPVKSVHVCTLDSFFSPNVVGGGRPQLSRDAGR